MHYYPINLNLNGKKCVIIGGGEVAERKAGTILSAGGEVFVISPNLTAELLAMAEKGMLVWQKRIYQTGDMNIEDFFAAVCATDNAEVNLSAAQEAKQKKILVDMADNMPMSDFTVPAHVRRGDLIIAVSTGGKSPAFAREIRKEISAAYGEEYGTYLELIAKMRSEMKNALPEPKDRETFWRHGLDREALSLLREGKTDEAKEKLERFYLKGE
jgi:precorrin-2 dehydrogenase/sirohydrochlorin ferrochelatase